MLLRAGLFALPLSFLAAFHAAAVPESVQIPLYHKTFVQKTGLIGHKLGIRIGLGGGPKKLYEFDTGAPGFYAAYNPQWWRNYRPTNASPITQTYSSGNTYVASVVSTKLDFGYGVPKVRANIAMVTDASGGSVANWLPEVAAGVPPLDQHFFGDFGSALNSDNGLYAILPQLPGNLSSGFVVSTGGYQRPKAYLTIGLTSAVRAQFPYIMKMHPDRGARRYPGSRRPLYEQEVVNTRVTLQNGGQSARFETGVVFDTGAPTTTIRNVNDDFPITGAFLDAEGSGLSKGTVFTMTRVKSSPVPPWIMSFVAGGKSGYNQVDYTMKALPSHPVAYVNTGLNPYFRFDVMFDLENGEIGFRPITPGQPRIEIDGPATLTTGQGQIVIRGHAEGRSQLLSRVEYSLNGQTFQPVVGLNDWRFTVELSSGTNEITVRAKDIAGGFTEKQVAVTVR
jgi:hypothetical protein